MAGRQAILVDIGDEKLYLFGLVLWPQEPLLPAVVAILAATGQFLVTAPAGCAAALPARRPSKR